jgi:ABC-type glycerol-3-phosphate transport system substrate-binding protein
MIAPLAACGAAGSATLASTTASVAVSANTGAASLAPASTMSAASTATQAASVASTTAAATTSSAASTAAAQATTTSSAASTAAAQATTTSSAASTAAAAAQASSTAAASIKPGTSGTLTWTVSFDPPNNQPQYDAFVAPWNQANPQAKVEAYNVSGGTVAVNEKILTLAAAGTPFDVIGYITFIQSLAKPGVVQPLEPFMSRDKYDISGYNPNTLKTFGSYGGKQYSLPWGLGGNAAAFIYSPNKVAAAGLAPPSQDWKNPFTWDQYRDYAQKLTQKQGTTYSVAGTEYLGDWNYTVPMQWGAHWVSPDGAKAICNSPEMIQALSSYLDIVVKDKTTTISPGVKLSASGNDKRWAAGETAMNFIGGWEINAFSNPALYKNDYVMATFPKGTVSSPDQDTIQLAVGANIKDPASAWNFMKWLFQDARYANLVLRMPVLTSDAVAWSKKAFAKVPATVGVDVLTSSLAIAQAPDPVRAIPANAQFDKTIVTPLWNNLIAQKVTVPDGLAQAQTQLQALLDQTNK